MQNKIFNKNLDYWDRSLSIKIFRKEYPRYPTIDQVTVTEEEKTYMIDLRPFMNPSPYTVQHVSIFLLIFFFHTLLNEKKIFFFLVCNTATNI